jgi:hypothetical protein
VNLSKAVDIEYQFASEFATLKFLQGTTVPAPRVYAYDVASNASNEIGVTF